MHLLTFYVMTYNLLIETFSMGVIDYGHRQFATELWQVASFATVYAQAFDYALGAHWLAAGIAIIFGLRASSH